VVKVLTNTNARWPSPQLRWARSNRSGRPRCQDITARYGGEEFAVVLPNTALRQALTVADHIRRAVIAKELKKKSTGEILGRVRISVGVCMLKLGDDTDSLIERRRLPLHRQAQRPQPRHLRSRSGICGGNAKSGGLASDPHGEKRGTHVSNHEAPIPPAAMLRDAALMRGSSG